MVLGLGGLGGAWRVASRVWGYPTWPGEALFVAAFVIWLAWIALYLAKWIYARSAAVAEYADPVAAFGLGLIPMATLMASIALKSWSPGLAWWLFVAGIAGGVALTTSLLGRTWEGARGLETITPLTILPSVGTAYTGALAASVFGYAQVAAMLWGPGVVTWIVIDSLILLRLLTHGLPVPLRATIGVQLAPPSVGCLAYLGFAEGAPDKLVHFLLGYALLQCCILLRLNSWIRAQPFSAGAWAFTFGVAALSGSTLLCLERQPGGALGVLAWPAFLFANAFIGTIAARTIALALSGRLFPQTQPQPLQTKPA